MIAGWVANKPGSSLLTTNETVWADSFEGPSLMPVAQLLTVWLPESSRTFWSGPC